MNFPFSTPVFKLILSSRKYRKFELDYHRNWQAKWRQQHLDLLIITALHIVCTKAGLSKKFHLTSSINKLSFHLTYSPRYLCVSLTENPTVLARREVSFRRMMAQCWTWPVAIKESWRRLWSWFILQLLSELQYNRSKRRLFPHYEPLKLKQLQEQLTALSSPQNAKNTDGGRVERRSIGV